MNTPRTRHNQNDSNFTPAPTPTHKYNKWADDRKKTGATPIEFSKRNKSRADDDLNGNYEEDQRRLDREWYGMDETEGFDQDNNLFASMSEEFLNSKQVVNLIIDSKLLNQKF